MNLLRIALQSIAVNWVRTLLAIIALSSSVVGVVTVASAAATIETTVTHRALMADGSPSTLLVSGLNGAEGLTESVEWKAQLQPYVGGGSVARIAQLESATIVSEGRSDSVDISFTEPELTRNHPFEVLGGRWLGGRRDTVAVPVVVNRLEANALDLRLGGAIELRASTAETTLQALVVGVVEDGAHDQRAYVALADADAFLRGNQAQLTTSLEVAAPGLATEDLTRRLNGLSSLRGVRVDWAVQRVDTVGGLRQEVEATRSAFLVVGILGLVAGAVAVANIGLSAVRERSSELSLRRALGARRWHLPAVMVLESQLIAVVAGVVAIAMSWAIYPTLAQQFGAPYGIAAPPYPTAVAAAGILVGMGTALLGGLVPAVHSMRAPIASIMRA
ncbi:ABC transporter permease [Galbitalea soli]|uniref:ABC transporter permease n=1 Tax=Galbitalea soli TaxID=1268042 RepID=A0A7C9TRX1_9MICO|nr:ABC transporter permease [Galbitalea soli]NEM92496.1 ABC transporter permease [Galbitalea soli]NYJ29533.1 putative ABC transport system permease protein [Galbitalea soli]